MEHYVIKGGTPLSGEIEIAGAKNAALAILAAAIMADEPVTIENVPDVSDIRAIVGAVEEIGAAVSHPERHTYVINGKGIRNEPVDTEAVRKIRGSYYLIGALLGKYKQATVALPGGC
ncbi:MAG: UDP-N-acetylglucosamine 1-carboxyvinyltransferase, partial [Lachnospiraceae bacterium]